MEGTGTIMQVTIELSDDQMEAFVESVLREADEKDPIEQLSISFAGDEPMLLFCPDWPFQYEAKVSLQQALQEELEHREADGDEPEKVEILKRLLAVLTGS
jgi:hypothetical protein